MRRRQRVAAAPTAWGRKKLLALLAGVAVTVLALLVGLGLSIHYTLQPRQSPTPDAGSAGPPGPEDAREVIAQRPMVSAPPEAAHPGPLTTKPFGVLVLPGARVLGDSGVSTGFPRTSQGALAQLIAIDQAALQSASVPGAQAVISAWALPGGPTAESWSGVKAIADLLASAGLPATGSPSLTVSATPAMGLVKGAVGDGYVVACVDFVVTATVTSTARVATADCQRMVWTPHTDAATDAAGGAAAAADDGFGERDPGGRWMVGPGEEPAPPPSVWPGTEAAHAAGYLELRYE